MFRLGTAATYSLTRQAESQNQSIAKHGRACSLLYTAQSIKDNKETIKEETKVSESDTEESTAQERKEENNTVEKAVEAPPLGAILDKRTEEIRNVVFGAMAQYGIPASLMDYMLTSVLSEVRDLKSKEYSDCLVNKGE